VSANRLKFSNIFLAVKLLYTSGLATLWGFLCIAMGTYPAYGAKAIGLSALLNLIPFK
jgi:hypothetical protein